MVFESHRTLIHAVERNGLDLPGVDGNGQLWSGMAGNGWEWARLAGLSEKN